MNKHRFLLILLPVWILSCCNRQPAQADARAALPAAEVSVATVVRQTLPLTEEITGTVRARTRAVIEAKVSGRILTFNVTLGRMVKAGDVLATLEAPELQARLKSAQATFEQATRDEQRLAGLVASNAVSKADYDAAKGRLEVAVAGLDEAKTLQEYTRITAPFAGVITRKLADQGDLAAPGKPLLELENPENLQIEADIPEALIANLKPGMELPVHTKAAAASAKVAEISPAGDPNSRTFPVKLDLPPGSPLRPGQFVRLAVPVRDYQTLVIPAPALVVRGQMEMVFVNDNGKARLRLIRPGRQRDGTVEVMAGLDGGESLVTAGADKLMDGQALIVIP